MTEGIYQRQSTLGIDRDQCVMVVGCGGIGSWLGYFLGLAGVRTLHLYDGDKIEEHNLNRLPFTPAHVGRFKSDALAELIKAARPEVEVVAHAHFDPEFDVEVLVGANWVVCSTDSLKSRRMVYKAAKGKGIKYLECGADGHVGSVTSAPAEWATDAENLPGYQSVPVFVGPCVVAAGIASYFVLLGGEPGATYRVEWEDEGLGVRIQTFKEVHDGEAEEVEG
jgi:hypothetical protein